MKVLGVKSLDSLQINWKGLPISISQKSGDNVSFEVLGDKGGSIILDDLAEVTEEIALYIEKQTGLSIQ